jgi:crotonobetainyl-CoA:carnitine CoA-transferase CaiB-like acyl-CoA transferase
MVRMPAFGLDGPWRDRTGFAQTMEQVSGMAWVTGSPTGQPAHPARPVRSARRACTRARAARRAGARRRTGEEQLVESTMVEAGAECDRPTQVLERPGLRPFAGRDGQSRSGRAPQNLYACRAGRAVDRDRGASRSTRSGRGLGPRFSDRRQWATDPALRRRARADARRSDEIDAALASACAALERERWSSGCSTPDVPAAPVVHPSVIAHNPQVRARGSSNGWTTRRRSARSARLPMRFSDVPHWYRAPAPTLGQHTAEVLRELLGLDDCDDRGPPAERIVGNRPVGL